MVKGFRVNGLGTEIFETKGDGVKDEELCVGIDELANEETTGERASHFFLGGAEGQSLGK